jgi:hypothetical protein
MNEAQHRAAIRSIATELHRLAHSKELPADADERDCETALDLGHLMTLIPQLCQFSISGLLDLVFALRDAEEEIDPDDRAAKQ